MPSNLTANPLEQLQRAIFAQLSPMTGTRASGTVLVTATDDGDVVLVPNTYLVPRVGGQAIDHRLYKVAPNPATAGAHGTGGEWTIASGSTEEVAIVSNMGGAEQNLPASAYLEFDPLIAGLNRRVELVAAITNGSNDYADTPSLVHRAAFWQSLPPGNAAAAFFAAQAGAFPAMLMVWLGSQTLQGRTSGGQQGDTRGGRGDRFMRERFQLFFASNKSESGRGRRNQGWIAMQGATALLSDRRVNDDGETLSGMGAGIEITSRDLAVAGTDAYIYSLEFEVNSVLSTLDARSFGPWLKYHYVLNLAGRESIDEDGEVVEEEDFPLVDATELMPHDEQP